MSNSYFKKQLNELLNEEFMDNPFCYIVQFVLYGDSCFEFYEVLANIGSAFPVKVDWIYSKYSELMNMEVELVKSFTPEGDGAYHYHVYKFTNDGEFYYVKVKTINRSYIDSQFDGMYFVTPKEEKVINYYPS